MKRNNTVFAFGLILLVISAFLMMFTNSEDNVSLLWTLGTLFFGALLTFLGSGSNGKLRIRKPINEVPEGTKLTMVCLKVTSSGKGMLSDWGLKLPNEKFIHADRDGSIRVVEKDEATSWDSDKIATWCTDHGYQAEFE
jgi:thiol:disulfide interchange protein